MGGEVSCTDLTPLHYYSCVQQEWFVFTFSVSRCDHSLSRKAQVVEFIEMHPPCSYDCSGYFKPAFSSSLDGKIIYKIIASSFSPTVNSLWLHTVTPCVMCKAFFPPLKIANPYFCFACTLASFWLQDSDSFGVNFEWTGKTLSYSEECEMHTLVPSFITDLFGNLMWSLMMIWEVGNFQK